MKCVVNVFYSIKILGAYKLRTSRTSGDINICPDKRTEECAARCGVCLYFCGVDVECGAREKRMTNPMGKLLTYFVHNDFAGMLMRTYTSFGMTCI